MQPTPLLRPGALKPLSGDEPLGDVTVADFWRWALGDLRMNNARGYLVEYLVQRAIGDSSTCRVEWDNHDATAADGTRVEIKTTGYLQSWASKRISTPRWDFKSVRSDKIWSDGAGEYVAVDPEDRVHVWVFALHTLTDPAAYDPLALDPWAFRVVPHRQLLRQGQTSAGLPFFGRLGIEPVGYGELAEAVRRAREANDLMATRS